MKSGTEPPKQPALALYAGIGLAALLTAFYFKIILPYVLFPADLLMWGETDFIGNIIRVRGGYPAYSPVNDLNSSTYPPVASLVTYAIARILQLPIEVPALRAIQMAYVALAAMLGTICWRALRSLLFPGSRLKHGKAWSALVLLSVFLGATAPGTGEWVHALHTDALTLLWSIITFAVTIGYVARPTPVRFVLLAVTPAIGFAIKQYGLIWAPIMFLTLVIDDPRNIRRLIWLVILTGASTAAAFLAGYLLWGREYVFWVFQVVSAVRNGIGLTAGGFNLSLPRAVDHLLRAWGPLSVGFFGGWLLFRRTLNRRAVALWLPWLLLVATEALTSGTGWGALYHFGPGVAIGVIWFFVSLPEAWPESLMSPLPQLIRSAASVTGLFAFFLALGVVPTGNNDLQRYWKQQAPDTSYVAAIQSEFEGYDDADVLVDWGNWLFLRHNYLARDRAIAMAEFAAIDRRDLLEPLLERIRTRRYKKILLHHYHARSFVYDWGNLDRPTGVREALQANYDEVRTIQGLPRPRPGPGIQYDGPVSVLVPRRPAASAAENPE